MIAQIFLFLSVILPLSLSPSILFAKAEQSQVIELTNKLVDGKKTWLPAVNTAKAGNIKFKLVNTLDEPHGFDIPGVMKEGAVVMAHETKTIEVKIPKAGRYDLKCQMHPAHVGAKLDVK